MNRLAKKLLLAVSSGICLLVLAAGLLMWSFGQPPSAYSRVGSLVKGMRKEEVVEIVGTPSNEYNGGRTLAYTRPLAWGILYVYLDDDGRFLRYYYDR